MSPKKFIIVSLSFTLFSACAPTASIDSSIHDAAQTASGTIHQAVQPIVNTAKDVQQRAEHVKNGWEKLMDAMSEIRKAL